MKEIQTVSASTVAFISCKIHTLWQSPGLSQVGATPFLLFMHFITSPFQLFLLSLNLFVIRILHLVLVLSHSHISIQAVY